MVASVMDSVIGDWWFVIGGSISGVAWWFWEEIGDG